VTVVGGSEPHLLTSAANASPSMDGEASGQRNDIAEAFQRVRIG
jgi:hypothetical protein